MWQLIQMPDTVIITGTREECLAHYNKLCPIPFGEHKYKTITHYSIEKKEVLVRAKSIITGNWNVMTLPCSKQEYMDAYVKWHDEKMLIQNAFPFLNADQREFIINGTTPEEWAKHLPDPED